MQKSLSNLKKLSNKESLNKYHLNFIDSSFGGWKIDENTTKFLGRIIEKFKPENVLEFGSGTSTLLFANEIKKGNIKKHDITILKYYKLLKLLLLKKIIGYIGLLLSNKIESNLTGNNPNLIIFDFYRISYLCRL